MKTRSKRELNQQTAQVLDGVSVGHAVIVTERGVPRWRSEAVENCGGPVARLRAAGRITPAKPKPVPWWPSAKASYTHAQVDALFDESRGVR